MRQATLTSPCAALRDSPCLRVNPVLSVTSLPPPRQSNRATNNSARHRRTPFRPAPAARCRRRTGLASTCRATSVGDVSGTQRQHRIVALAGSSSKYIRVTSRVSTPRASTPTSQMRRLQRDRPGLPPRPGMTVVNANRPSSAGRDPSEAIEAIVERRPAGIGRHGGTFRRRSACQISTSASGSGSPAPSRIVPFIREVPASGVDGSAIVSPPGRIQPEIEERTNGLERRECGHV